MLICSSHSTWTSRNLGLLLNLSPPQFFSGKIIQNQQIPTQQISL